ncbi:MAG: glycosyltransferase family 4 protein [Phycisphaerales bacterium]|nr:glycosyltransferase family 4 protein [Hyphomonadaceae bacterium]
MKIAYIHNIVMPGREANTVNVAKMCNALSGLGAEVTLVAANSGDPSDLGERIRAHYDLEQNFEVRALPSFAARPSMAGVVGALQAQQARADLVWTRAPHAAIAACAVGLPTLLEVHTDLSAFSALGRQAFHRAVGHSKLVGLVTISTALAQHLAGQFPAIAERIIVAHDGADDRDASPAPVRPAGSPLHVGYVGSLYKGRGIELIEAVAATSSDRFTIVGPGAESLSRPDAPANILYREAVPHARVPAMLAGFDVLIAPYQRSVMVADGKTDSVRWMSPLKLFEYMAARRPVLTSDLPVIREILRDGETALLRAPEDIGAWAAALALLRQAPHIRADLAERAYAQFQRDHTWRSRAAGILSELDPLLARTRPRTRAPRSAFADQRPSPPA